MRFVDVTRCRCRWRILGGVSDRNDPVLWVAAVHTAAVLDGEMPVRQFDRLVEVLSDTGLRPRFEEVWYQVDFDQPSEREAVVWWIAGPFAGDSHCSFKTDAVTY
nr:hypothetical protein KPHV_85390 [Kitasatospora purpeofusca]